MLDSIIHQPVRLRGMSVLVDLGPGDEVDFTYLKKLLGLTDGNLGRTWQSSNRPTMSVPLYSDPIMFATDFLHQGRKASKGMHLLLFAFFAAFCKNLVPAPPGWD